MTTQLTVAVQGQGVTSANQLNTYAQTCDGLADMQNFVGVTGVQVYMRGYTALNDGGQGNFYWDSTATGPGDDINIIQPNGVTQGAWVRSPVVAPAYSSTYTAPFTGAVTRTVQSKLADFVNVADFGADATGVIPCQAAVQHALDSGLNVWFDTGTFTFTDAVVCRTPGQIIQGRGRGGVQGNNVAQTLINIPSNFNLSATAVFNCLSGEEGPQFRDFKVAFTQPDTSVRGDLIAYPPAFSLVAQPRFQMCNLAISNAMTAVDMTGNSGGAFLDNLEISSYDYAVKIDGCLDTVRLTRIQCWPFDLTTAQTSIYFDTNCHGFSIGRCDDIIVEACLWINGGHQMRCFANIATGNYGPFGSVSDCDFDTFSDLLFEDGEMSFTGCLFTLGVGNTGKQAVKQLAGALKFVGCQFETGSITTNPLVQLTSVGPTNYGDPTLLITGCQFRMVGDMTTVEVGASTGSVHSGVVNNIFYTQNIAVTKPVIHAKVNSRLTAIGNSALDQSTPGCFFIKLDADEHHMVVNNTTVGWGVLSPYPISFATIYANDTADTWIPYTPVATPTSGAFTNVVGGGSYKQIGKTCHYQWSLNFVNNGTGSGTITLSLPITAKSIACGVGKINGSTGIAGHAVTLYVNASGATGVLADYANAYPGATGNSIGGSITYETV